MQVRDVELNVNISGEGFPFIWGHGLMSSMAVEDGVDWFQWERMAECAQLIRYDARGHGLSETSDQAVDYRWDNLALDMLGIVDEMELETFIAGGQSMGCATAIYAAVAAPERVRALLLVNPPTAWETRAAKASNYKRMAFIARLLGGKMIAKMLMRNPAQLFAPWLVEAMEDKADVFGKGVEDMSGKRLSTILKGAEMSDLPPRDEIAKLEMPVLILAWEGDETHPLETAETLHELLPQSKLHVAKDVYDFRTWPLLMREFVEEVGGG
jgi:pimeloyl-ACP methyl ester carboxylesterase